MTAWTRSTIRGALALTLMMCLTDLSRASIFTGAGLDGAGRPVSASADLSWVYNPITDKSTITIILKNATASTVSADELLTGLIFPGSSSFTTADISARSGTLIGVASDGTATTLGDPLTDWVFETVGGSNALTFHGAGSAPGARPPDDAIIGPAEGIRGGNPWYTNANSSIAGNGPHNPFINQVATFTLIENGQYSLGVDPRATFLFGTEFQGSVPAIISASVPEPASLSLLALGGLAMIRRRKH